MTAPDPSIPSEPFARLALSYREFIALTALLMSIAAMSIDIMLPALPDIGATLGVRDASRLPLVSVMFNVDQALDSAAMGFAGIDAEVHSNPRRFENFELGGPFEG